MYKQFIPAWSAYHLSEMASRISQVSNGTHHFCRVSELLMTKAVILSELGAFLENAENFSGPKSHSQNSDPLIL